MQSQAIKNNGIQESYKEDRDHFCRDQELRVSVPKSPQGPLHSWREDRQWSIWGRIQMYGSARPEIIRD